MGFGFSFKDLGGMGSAAISGLAKNVPNLLDPSGSRLAIAGLLKGGTRPTQKKPPTQLGFGMMSPKGEVVPIEKDWRVRVSVARESGIFYQGDPGILEPLKSTMGVVFPYTPSITINYSATYSSVKPTHSNYPSFFYENSDVQAINVVGDFTVQTKEEGRYLLACIYFFRAATKMFFGNNPAHQGNPPPVLFLNGYGTHILPDVPCVLTSYQHSFDKDVDYIEIPSIMGDPMLAYNSGAAWTGETATKGPYNRLPTTSQITIQLQPIYSRNKVTQFDLQAFARGDLIKKGFL